MKNKLLRNPSLRMLHLFANRTGTPTPSEALAQLSDYLSELDKKIQYLERKRDEQHHQAKGHITTGNRRGE